MWKSRRRWLLLIALVGVALSVYFEPTHCVRGWLWGEAFFDGRPTSWWRLVVLEYVDPKEPNRWTEFNTRIVPEDWHGTAFPLVGDPAAKPVFRELANDDDELVAQFADHFLTLLEHRHNLLDTDFERRVEFQFYLFKTR